MLNNFYKKNYYDEKLHVFTSIKDNDKLILKNNNLIIKNNDNDECNNFLPILSLLVRIFSNENEDQGEIKTVEKNFTEYLEFIDNIIQYMHQKQCFQDQYLILLSEIEKNNDKINEGLIKLINSHHKEKSVLFSLFDFSKLLSEIKTKLI